MHKICLLCGLLLSTLSFAANEETLYVPQADIPVPPASLKQTANFDDLRHNVLDLISSGRKRIWLLTDYLTDGDIVSALYLAKYRKVDVKVFLGKSRLNSYLSRLNYLKAQNIPVFTRPAHGFVAPTVILVDQKLFTINRDLNVLAKLGQAQITQASPSEVATFVSWFTEVTHFPTPAEPTPMPAVGRAGGSKPQRGWQGSAPVSSYKGESNGAYNYDRSARARQVPEGISTKLPRVLRWQKNQEAEAEKAKEKAKMDAQPAADGPLPGMPPANSAVEADPFVPGGKPKLIDPGPLDPLKTYDPSHPRLDEEMVSPPPEER